MRASAFLETDGRIALTPDLIAGKIMPNYRPLIDDIIVTLSAAAPEYLTFALPGDFNGWSNAAVMTPNDDRTVFSYTISETIVAGSHQGQMLMYYNDQPSWDHKLLGNKSDNYEFSFSKLHEQSGYNLNEEDMELEGEALVVEFLPDPDAMQAIKLTVKVVADAALTEGLYAIGSFNGWTDPGVALTAGEGNVYTVEFDEEDGFTAETAYGNFALKGADWHHKIQPDTLFTTLEGDTLVTITFAAGAAAYFNTATEAWDGLSEELYSVQVTALA